MRIGEIAQRTDLSLRTLRHYDEVGLLRPSGRSEGGFRLYTEHDLDELLVIRRMKPLGFTLEEMVEVMRSIRTAGPDDADAVPARHRLGEVLAAAQERRGRLARQLAMADEFIEMLRTRLPSG